MSETSTVPAGSDNPVEQRTCRDCGETKNVSPETWPYRNRGKGTPYHAHANRCSACETIRKQKYEKRRDEVAELVAESADAAGTKVLPGGGGKAKAGDKRKDEVEQAKLDAAKSLKLGSRVLNQSAAGVLARILEWAENPADENHRWAVQFLAERILPRKLYEELGGQAAGIGQLGDKAPQFVIQVLPASPDQPAGHVIQGQHQVISVEALPSPQ